MTLAAGIWLEGVNFAIGSGLAAGRTAAAAAAKGDSSTRALAAYRKDLEAGFVLQDHKRLRGAPGLVLSDRVQRQYPGMVADLVEGLFTVTNPTAKPGAVSLLRRTAKAHGVKLRHLVADGIKGGRVFG
jgi:electron transfer flavoprotein-quinone oxidoreductase